MFPMVRNALSHLQVQIIQQTTTKQSHQKHTLDFHDKYGNVVLTDGATFCVGDFKLVCID
uniref:Cytochrome c oxidase subunit 7B, mitochondrial n=1 Tax=Oryctolagus cuniculus TaxID=9986 RepID=A0A5F9D4R5_RABIT